MINIINKFMSINIIFNFTRNFYMYTLIIICVIYFTLPVECNFMILFVGENIHIASLA